MSKTEKNYFKDMVATDVSKHVKKKGNYSYLSWAIAWNYLKQEDENAQRNVYEAPETGLNWFSDGMTGYVKVGIALKGIEHIDYLPIKDFRHKSLTVDKITSMDVNTAIQRSTAKAIAMHGLGLSIFANEDTLIIPDFEEMKKPIKNDGDKKTTYITLDIGDTNWDKVLSYVAKNKSLGLEEITKRLKSKYEIKATVKKELAKSMKDE
tara:strand:+ start:1676 stop:2299 length:624 start_codon:yes stop_codon:yes gene_type:complete